MLAGNADGQMACKVEGRLFSETGQEGQARIELLADRLSKQFLPPSQELLDPAEWAQRGFPDSFQMVLKIDDEPGVLVDTSTHEWEKVQAPWNVRSPVIPLMFGAESLATVQFAKRGLVHARKVKGVSR